MNQEVCHLHICNSCIFVNAGFSIQSPHWFHIWWGDKQTVENSSRYDTDKQERKIKDKKTELFLKKSGKEYRWFSIKYKMHKELCQMAYPAFPSISENSFYICLGHIYIHNTHTLLTPTYTRNLLFEQNCYYCRYLLYWYPTFPFLKSTVCI